MLFEIEKNEGEFTCQFTGNARISQGFRNYKKILSACVLLDEVYDINSGYAFLKAK
jgi:hypothetical protein